MNTLKQTLFLLLALVFSGVSKTIAQSTGVYVGGHIRRERPGTIEKLRNSGFTYIILFNINVEPDGLQMARRYAKMESMCLVTRNPTMSLT